MFNGYDIAYSLLVGAGAPYWLIKPSARRKVLGALRQRMGRGLPTRDLSQPAVLIHAVSLGEINATRALVRMLQEQRPDLHVIISTTTETGHARGEELYGSAANVTLIRYPLDFSGAVQRVLDGLKPSVVVLMELEVWPNFVRRCEDRGIPVILANGRLTQTSFGRYKWAGPVTRAMFRRLSFVAAQDERYAKRFVELGAQPEHVQVIGTMKFDTAEVADRVVGDGDVAASVWLRPLQEPIWVCGSTGPGEEEIVLKAYRSLLTRGHSRLRLVIVPRHPQRFDEVSAKIKQMHFRVVRRSRPKMSEEKEIVPRVILGDTMGELRKFYSLADLVFVGRSLVDLGQRQHGSDMIEPAALGKPVIVGPFTHNFADAMSRFKAADAMLEVPDGAALEESIHNLLVKPDQARAMGERAQQVVLREQGATGKHVKLILEQMNGRAPV
jgi:3-deoxy-D-manno-octulosonic-acid transferase